jgi:hypothetical protein
VMGIGSCPFGWRDGRWGPGSNACGICSTATVGCGVLSLALVVLAAAVLC